MVNHAARGRRSENNVRDELGAYGYDVIRSAASKGSADLIAIGDGFAVLVQVKLVKHGESFQMPSPAEREQLLRIASRLGNAYPVAACHAQGSGGKPAVTAYRLLTGPGPKDWRWWAPGQPMEDEQCPKCQMPTGYHILSCPAQPQVIVPFTDLVSVVKL
jgi:Holliday junction resolvase